MVFSLSRSLLSFPLNLFLNQASPNRSYRQAGFCFQGPGTLLPFIFFIFSQCAYSLSAPGCGCVGEEITTLSSKRLKGSELLHPRKAGGTGRTLSVSMITFLILILISPPFVLPLQIVEIAKQQGGDWFPQKFVPWAIEQLKNNSYHSRMTFLLITMVATVLFVFPLLLVAETPTTACSRSVSSRRQ